MDDEERAWILESRNGNPLAFECLIRKYQRMIHALTFRMTGTMADAEDLAQETFLQAHRELARFRGEASFSSWLYRIAVNKCLNWRQRESRRQQVHEEWSRSSQSEEHGDDSASRQVQEALLHLPPKQRAAVILTLYEGHNHAAAARILGCSEATVSWRVFAARKQLKRRLSAKGPGDE